MDRPKRSSRIAFGLVLLAASAMLGCQSISGNNRNQGLNNSALMASPMDFGMTVVGGTKTLTETIHNLESSPVTISAATVEGASFGVIGPRFPLTVPPGGSAALSFSFTPHTSGSLTGRVSITSNASPHTSESLTGRVSIASNASNRNTYVLVSGFGVVSPGQLSVNPPSISFGNLAVGQRREQIVTLTNSGDSDVTVSAATVTGSAFSLSGPRLPQVLAANQSTALTVVFSPSSEGTFGTAITVASKSPSFNLNLPLLNVPLSGNGVSSGNGGGSSIPAEFFTMQMNSGTVGRWPWPSVSFGGIRLWDSQTQWANINTGDGVYDWTILDKWLADAQAHNVDVLYTFGRTPNWVSSKPTDPNCGEGLGTCDPPNELNPDGSGSNQYWKNFVTALVAHNQSSNTGHIKYWEIWNEPYHTQGWNGTIAQMLRMAQDATAIIKAADPSAMVLTPSFVFTFEGRTWLDSYLAAGGGQYADSIAFHGYVQRPGHVVPEDFNNDLSLTKTILANHGQEAKALWDTEASWGYTSKTGFTDLDMQAAFVDRLYLLHWSNGVARFYWYQWNAQNTVGTLWKPDRHNLGGPGTVLKPGIAYGQIYNWMVGATMTSPCTASASVWTCQLSRPNGYQALAVWDASQTCSNGVCGTTPYTYDPLYIKYRDSEGNATALSGQTVPIGAKPILLENQ
jgi:hypothetical protein